MPFDDYGVSAVMEYIITFTIAFIIFMFMLLMFNGLFIDGPQKTVSACQFTDIGNDVTAQIVDTYLIAPKSGNISTVFEIPDTVAGKPYTLNIQTSSNGWDKEIMVLSPTNGVSIKTTLNGVNMTVPLSGSTSSQNSVHRIKYDS
jgi:hypothetical protein